MGEFAAMDHCDRRLIGEIVSIGIDEEGTSFATLKHFNGEPWPITPPVALLEWIKQDGGK